MIDQLLANIESLDLRVSTINAGDLELLEPLLGQRANAISRLLNLEDTWSSSQLDRLGALGSATETLQGRFRFLREHTVESMGVLNRHDQLLRLISDAASKPCYVDYSG